MSLACPVRFLDQLRSRGLQVVVYDLTVAQRHVPEMLASLDHAHDWKRCHRAANVRDHEELCRSSPGALQANIVEPDLDQLRDFWRVIVNVGK